MCVAACVVCHEVVLQFDHQCEPDETIDVDIVIKDGRAAWGVPSLGAIIHICDRSPSEITKLTVDDIVKH